MDSLSGGKEERQWCQTPAPCLLQLQTPQHPNQSLCVPHGPAGCVVADLSLPHAHGPHAHQQYCLLAANSAPEVHQQPLAYPGYRGPPPTCAAGHPSHSAPLVSCLPPGHTAHGHAAHAAHTSAHAPPYVCVEPPCVYIATAPACGQPPSEYAASCTDGPPAQGHAVQYVVYM